MQGIIAFILIFFVVVTIHEFGHFIAAKRAGIFMSGIRNWNGT